jgi:xylan 1,4-beta-xylosidase
MVVSSEKPEGPYCRPVFIDEDGIDPSIFHEDGRHYMLLNRGARIFELSSDCTEKISEPVLLYYGSNKHAPEGPHLLKKAGYYYLFQAEGGTGPGHRITVARSRTLMGVYEPCPYNPILRQNDPGAGLQRCGHGKPVCLPDGRWYMVYLCGRNLEGLSMLGRETALDPITWTIDGWPIVNDLKGPSALSPKPLEDWIPETPSPSFTGGKWPLEWMTPREPEDGGAVPQADGIHLLSSPTPLESKESRNLFLHRQESFRFTAEIELQLPMLGQGQEAGLICYYDENTFVTIMTGVYEQGFACIVREHIGRETIVHEACVLEEQEACYRFAVETDGLKRVFSLRDAAGQELYSMKLERVYYLSDEGIPMGKRFTGAVFGVGAAGAKQFEYIVRSVRIENR